MELKEFSIHILFKIYYNEVGLQIEYIFIYKLYFEGEIYMSVTRGLEGVIATESSICSIIDDKLTYAGYSIDDLTENTTFEEVVYLLWNRELPNKEQLAEIKKELAVWFFFFYNLICFI